MKTILALALTANLLIAASPVHAETAQEMLRILEKQAGSPGSPARGEKMFFAKRTHSNGDTVSCTTCHTDNPKATGKTRANKLIEPIAPIANRERFTDPAKVEKWFKRNCKDVLERACTEQEKADFIAFMISVK